MTAPPESPSDPVPSSRPRAPVLVLGCGGFGTALAISLRSAGHAVRVWGVDPSDCREIEARRENRKFLPGVRIPPEIRFDSAVEELVEGVRTVLSVIPTQFLRSALGSLATHLPPDATYVSCSKGFERGTLELPSRILHEALPRARIGVLSGPSHAEEVGRGLPTTVVVAADPPEVAREIQAIVAAPRFRVYTSPDPLGVEIAGAAKNVIALAAGISDGLGFGDNARAALVCRGATEITRLGSALGARTETFSGLSGIGDLVVTCTSLHSRNHEVGRRIGEGEALGEILASTEKVAEGVETTRSVLALAERHGVEVPITREVHAVLFGGKAPREAVVDLMNREPRSEG